MLPDLESQKYIAQGSCKALSRSSLSTLKSLKSIPIDLCRLLDATDVLKEKQPGSWKQDSTSANQFADSFQKFDIDTVSIETFSQM